MIGRSRAVVAVFGIGLCVVIFAAMYFWSDVFRTHVDTAARDFSQWTPENIAKDPGSYLNFCETQAQQALSGFRAHEIAVAQNRAKLVDMKAEGESKVKVGEKAVGELKQLYEKTDPAGKWPVLWRGEERAADWVKRQIVALHRQMESQKHLVAKVEVGIKNLDAQVLKIQDGRAKAQEQLAEITANREMLKVQKLSNTLAERLVAMKGAIQATVSTASEATGIISLEQLAKDDEGSPDEQEFSKIMGGGKSSGK